MNILFYLYQFPAFGGIETVTATLANMFHAKGHQVAILSHVAKASNCTALKLDSGIRLFRMPDTVHGVTRANQQFMRNCVDSLQTDIIIFQDSYARIEKNLFQPKKLTQKIVVCEHNSPYVYYQRDNAERLTVKEWLGRLKYPLMRLLLWQHDRIRRRYLYEHCDRYVLLSSRFFGEFKAVTRLLDSRKLMAIPNPLSPISVAAAVVKTNEIVFAATLIKTKGCDYLLEAWEVVMRRLPDWKVTILGDGPDRARLEWFVRERKLERVNFCGYQADVAPFFARAKVFAFPSRREGWGLVLVEAMSNGCVPICFDSYSSVHDIVQNGVNGLVIPAFDVGAFADGLESLAVNEPQREKMAAAGPVAAKKFSPSNIGAQWDMLLQSLVHD